MKNILIKILFTVFILIILQGCAHHKQDITVCRHLAVYTAILHQSENPQDEVALCLGYNETKKEFHVQSKYRKPGGEWVFLKQPPQFTNWDGVQDDFKIKQSVTIEYWLRNHLRVLDK